MLRIPSSASKEPRELTLPCTENNAIYYPCHSFASVRPRKYPIERLTEAHSLPYYVKESFAQDYDGSLRQLEGQVLEQHVYVLRERCFRERGQSKLLVRGLFTPVARTDVNVIITSCGFCCN